jgi:hypothetical protein
MISVTREIDDATPTVAEDPVRVNSSVGITMTLKEPPTEVTTEASQSLR